jgi:SAM-dependent methyltransferase
LTTERTDRRGGVVRIDDVADLITPMAVRVAASLRLADYVADGVGSVDDLAAKTGTHPPSLGVLVRHLVSVGVFAGGAEGGLVLTTLGKQLRLAQEFLDIENSVGRSELSLVRLLQSVRSGAPAYPLLFGRTFWADLAADAGLKASFDAMTDRHLQTELAPLLAGYDWSATSHIVDLGAGNGALLIHLLSSFEHLRGTILELPGNAEVAERNLAAAGLGARSAVVRGSFFEPLGHLPRGTYVLSSVLHDWNDDETAAILRRCSEVLRPAESLLVIDSFIDADQDDTRMDLRMLALFGGRQRTVADLTRIAQESGLRVAGARRLRKKWLLELESQSRYDGNVVRTDP